MTPPRDWDYVLGWVSMALSFVVILFTILVMS